MHYISGQNTSRNTNNGINDSKAPFSVLQDINTSPIISENSYLKQFSNKQTFENIEKARRSPWKGNFIKVEKYTFKNNTKSKSQNPSKPISSSDTPKKGRDKSQPQHRIVYPEKMIYNNVSSSNLRNHQPMNYNKIYQKLKAKSTVSRNNINSLSYGSFKIARYDNLNNTERKMRSVIDNVFNSLIVNNVNKSPFKKDGYIKHAMHKSRPFEIVNNNTYVKKPTTTRPKSANILKY